MAAEVKWWDRPESKEVSAAERVRLDGKEDLRITPVIISDSTVMKLSDTRNEKRDGRR